MHMCIAMMKKVTVVIFSLFLTIFSGYAKGSSDEPTKVTVRCGEHMGDSSDGCSYYGQINDGTGQTSISDWGQNDYSILGDSVKVSVQRDGSGGNVGYYLEIWIYAGTNEVAYSICKHDNTCSTDAAYESTAVVNAMNNLGTVIVLLSIILIGGFIFYNQNFKKSQLEGFVEKTTLNDPKIPFEGLPEGWTDEQWRHYGDEYLRKNSKQKLNDEDDLLKSKEGGRDE